MTSRFGWALVPVLASLAFAPSALAADDSVSSESDQPQKASDRIYIIGSKEQVVLQPGSASVITEAEIETYKFTDFNRLLRQVPGIQLQEEDGFGLRPNIGIRGATPERSRKIVFYQDGLLLHPAAYSAPAAYYMPMPLRFQEIEVFKGASAVRYGPNSIGGAINLITRPLTDQRILGIDLAAGSYDFYKTHLTYFDGANGWYWGIDAAKLETSGFKELPDDKQSTGFDRSDLMVKLGRDLTVNQRLEVMLAWDEEVSNETYLGLSQADFDRDPYQRYLGSEEDTMRWKNRQLRLSHFWEQGNFSLASRIYQNDLHRNWGKLSGFVDGPSLSALLGNPEGDNSRYFDILRGKQDTIGLEDNLKLGFNARTYQSQGIQFDAQWDRQLTAEWKNELSIGLRLHRDFEERRQYEEFRSVISGQLAAGLQGRQAGSERKDESEAKSIYLQNRLSNNGLALTLGIRFEEIENTQTNFKNGKKVTGSDSITVPGLGVVYKLTSEWTALASVHRGYTIVGPGQADSVKPEESLNFEAGVRYRSGRRQLDLIGFYNDYENIKGVCTIAGGCSPENVGDEFDGGKALIFGAELTAADYIQLSKRLGLSLAANYTLTDAHFTGDHISDNPEWGIGQIKSGDPLPYIAKHHASLHVGLESSSWSLNLLASRYSKKFDQSVAEGREVVPAHHVLDFSARYFVTPELEIYANIDNLLDEVYLASYRPAGLRPGKPRTFVVGTKLLY